ncbi:MAG: hypothetical protein LBT95_05460 [Treponema sp.]|nr:hypothetical protein [Treponema sp.]
MRTQKGRRRGTGSGYEPEELKARLDAGEPLQIIDIREPHERAIVKFPRAKAIPLGQMVRRILVKPDRGNQGKFWGVNRGRERPYSLYQKFYFL